MDAILRQIDGLLPHEIEYFYREGYLVVEDLLSDKDLSPVVAEITSEIDRRAADAGDIGKLSNSFEDLDFEHRLTAITGQTDLVIQGISSGALAGPAFFGSITHPRILNVAESLCGQELIASSAYRLRPKLPSYGQSEVPWHQNSAYFDPSCDNSLVLTVWLPLVDAREDNGCLFVIPRGHSNAVMPHQSTKDGYYLEIEPAQIQSRQAMAIPVRRGSVLLMTNLTPHASFQNQTEKIRWIMDLRYQSANLPTNALPSRQATAKTSGNTPPACYPPSADFLVRSQLHPRDVIRDAKQFQLLRRKHKFQLPTELSNHVKSGQRHVSVNPFSLLRWTSPGSSRQQTSKSP